MGLGAWDVKSVCGATGHHRVVKLRGLNKTKRLGLGDGFRGQLGGRVGVGSVCRKGSA